MKRFINRMVTKYRELPGTVQVFPVFALPVVRSLAIMVAIGTVVLAVIERFDPGSAAWGIAAFGIALHASALASTVQLVGRNLGWIKVLPVTRLHLLLFRYALGLFSLFAPVLALLATYGATRLMGVAYDFSRGGLFSVLYPYGPDRVGVFVFFGGLAFVHLLCIWVRDSESATRALRYATPVLKAKHWFAATLAIPAALVGIRLGFPFVETYVVTPFFFLALITLVSFAGGINLFGSQTGASVRQVRRWRNAGAVIAVVQLLCAYGAWIHELKSPEAHRRTDAILALGSWYPGLAQHHVTDAIRDSNDSWQLSQLILLHEARFGKVHGLDIKAALASKTDPSAFVSTLKLIREDGPISFVDWKFVSQKTQERFGERSPDLSFLLHTHFNAAQLQDLVTSRNPHSVRFALVAARYSKDSGAARMVRDAFRMLEDREKIQAAITLSVLEGRRIPIEEALAPGRELASLPSDCERVSPEGLDKLQAEDAATLNLCLRDHYRERMGLDLAQLESMGWIEPPLSKDLVARLKLMLLPVPGTMTAPQVQIAAAQAPAPAPVQAQAQAAVPARAPDREPAREIVSEKPSVPVIAPAAEPAPAEARIIDPEAETGGTDTSLTPSEPSTRLE
jgi:hypothetical protein